MIHVIVFSKDKTYVHGFNMHKSTTDAEAQVVVDTWAKSVELEPGYFFEVYRGDA